MRYDVNEKMTSLPFFSYAVFAFSAVNMHNTLALHLCYHSVANIVHHSQTRFISGAATTEIVLEMLSCREIVTTMSIAIKHSFLKMNNKHRPSAILDEFVAVFTITMLSPLSHHTKIK